MEKGEGQREKHTEQKEREGGGARKIAEIENKIKWENKVKCISHHYTCKWFKFNYYNEQTHILGFLNGIVYIPKYAQNKMAQKD